MDRKREEFLKKHGFNDLDYRNLIRYEEVRVSGIYNMYEYFELMKRNNLNGGYKLADWIVKGGNYEEFLSTLGKENELLKARQSKSRIVYTFGNINELSKEEMDLIDHIYHSWGVDLLNETLEDDEIKQRVGNDEWCQSCLKRRVNKGYVNCYYCDKKGERK